MLKLTVAALAFALVGTAAAAPGPTASAKIEPPTQERLCRDVARSGSRIADRVCGTSTEVQAYMRQDFYSKSSDPLLQGGVVRCWMLNRDGTLDKPCPPQRPVKPEKAVVQPPRS